MEDLEKIMEDFEYENTIQSDITLKTLCRTNSISWEEKIAEWQLKIRIAALTIAFSRYLDEKYPNKK